MLFAHTSASIQLSNWEVVELALIAPGEMMRRPCPWPSLLPFPFPAPLLLPSRLPSPHRRRAKAYSVAALEAFRAVSIGSVGPSTSTEATAAAADPAGDSADGADDDAAQRLATRASRLRSSPQVSISRRYAKIAPRLDRDLLPPLITAKVPQLIGSFLL